MGAAVSANLLTANLRTSLLTPTNPRFMCISTTKATLIKSTLPRYMPELLTTE